MGDFYIQFVESSFATRSNISSRLSSNSEACASELIANLEEMFNRYTTRMVMLSTGSNLQPQTDVLSFAKGLINKINRRFL